MTEERRKVPDEEQERETPEAQFERFTSLTRRLLRVPKREIQEKAKAAERARKKRS